MIPAILGLLGNFSAFGDIASCATAGTDAIKCFTGNWGVIATGIILVIAAFFVLYVLRQFLANAILGIIALLVIVYLLGLPIPLSPLVVIVSVLGGLGGVAALVIASFFGWL